MEFYFKYAYATLMPLKFVSTINALINNLKNQPLVTPVHLIFGNLNLRMLKEEYSFGRNLSFLARHLCPQKSNF